MRDGIRTWHADRDGEKKKRGGFKELSARAQQQGRGSLADDLDTIDKCLSVLRGRALRNAETALSGAGASNGDRVQQERSMVPREVRSSLTIQELATSLKQVEQESR